ncbi:MAG: UDP-N-acetylglucosamine 1-carboxyvinyltransferase [Clostridiales bacterium]|jgi:UDP-N-acetylglucosamine 1-carboxyvinyltransferase|nr:UDP-N-acetylglucosamine 1-carboxyvinyltransferase [Clostridiales bacterium]
MHKYIIRGGNRLNGRVELKAAKNSVLALIAASVLTEDDVVLKNCPDLDDILNKLKIINDLGAKALYNGKDIFINTKNAKNTAISYALAKTLRSSFVLVGPLLARFKKAKAYYPGGCKIGKRPVDIHLDAFRALNVKIDDDSDDFVVFDASEMRGADISLSFPSVGATQNAMMAAVCAPGLTTISNAAKEPEICDLQNLLNLMGAKVCGAGGPLITIEGVDCGALSGAAYSPIPDRIVAGTLIIAAAMCGGELTIGNCVPAHIDSLLNLLKNNLCDIKPGETSITVSGDGRLKALPEISSAPYPLFPTDLQPQITALAAVCRGTTKISENVFENRFNHIDELEKMGAQIYVNKLERTIVVRGVECLRGANVTASDLRCGAALVVAALSARGITVINNVEPIDRGYENFEETLKSLGADIVRVKECKRKPLQKIFDK